MELQTVGVLVAIIGGIISIVANAIAITYAFARLSSKLDTWMAIFASFEKYYESHKAKVDGHIEALWRKHDDLKDKVTRIETVQNAKMEDI